MTDLVSNLTQINWESLKGVGTLVILLVALLELLKRLKIIAGSKAIFWTGLGLGQVFAQVAFCRCDGFSPSGMADAALVGVLASAAAVGSHTMARKLLTNGNGGDKPT